MEAHRLTRLLVLLACAAGCTGRNVQTDSFATMREAHERGAVQRGWVPAILPADAYELRAAYDTGGWRRWGILNFRSDQAESLRRQLAPEEAPLAGMRLDIPARIEWWPVALRNELQPEAIASTGLRAYRARTGNLVFAVNWNQGRAYYWTVAE